MKVRFYVTVELPAQNSTVGKQSKTEVREWAESYINDRITGAMTDLNPTDTVVRISRATK